jgi:HK97 family phage major capsid protein
LEISVVTWPAYDATSVDAIGRELDRDLADLQSRAQARIAEYRRANPTTSNGASMTPATTTRRQPARARQNVYGPGTQHSWFRDMALVNAAAAIANCEVDSALGNLSGAQTIRNHPETGDAQKRLEAARPEYRALNDGAGTGADFFLIHGVPAFIASEFAASAYAEATVAACLRQESIPDGAAAVEVPQLGTAVPSGTAATAAVQTTEGSSVSATDPGTGLANSPIVTVAGEVVLSRQLLEMSAGGGIDTVLAAELGHKIGAALDAEIVSGPGGARRLTGILNVTGIQATTYTDGSPTAAKVLGAIGNVISDTAGNLGHLPDVTILHSRRFAWIATKAAAVINSWPTQVVVSNNIPTNQGSGTNQDAVIVLDSQETTLYLRPPTIRVIEDYSGTNVGQVKVAAHQYAALLAHRKPYSIGVLSGSGLTTPSWP